MRKLDYLEQTFRDIKSRATIVLFEKTVKASTKGEKKERRDELASRLALSVFVMDAFRLRTA